jgi:2-hydroxychromene-2-carboxylate isomerase
MGKIIDFYWDLGSTNSYFALHLIKPVAKKHDATVLPHPFNLGYVFRKQSYVLMEPTKFRMKTSPALRGALAMRHFGKEWGFMQRIFAAYWEKNDASVGDLSGLRPIAAELGVDQTEFEKLVESDEIRNELIAETDRGLERGVFGVPTFFVGDEMFWGKDRIEVVDDELTSPNPPRARRSQPSAAV